jgi:hypothetical protein
MASGVEMEPFAEMMIEKAKEINRSRRNPY